MSVEPGVVDENVLVNAVDSAAPQQIVVLKTISLLRLCATKTE
jgi:hypothetical protein